MCLVGASERTFRRVEHGLQERGMADDPYSFGGTPEYMVSLFTDTGLMKK